MIDQDTRAVIARLDVAVARSGLSAGRFARALGISPSRFSSYRSGKAAPSAAFLIRSERLAGALEQSRREGIPTVIDAVDSIQRAVRIGDDNWTYTLVLEARDRLRDILRRRKALAGAWEVHPTSLAEDRWTVLLAAFVSHEFDQAGLQSPVWAAERRLANEWVLDTPRLTVDQVKRETPEWLAARNIFISEKDLITL